jgi:hypothetical protein
MTEIKPAEQYTAEQMSALLTVGAELAGTDTMRAAVHLLTFTALPGRRDFARLVEVAEVTDRSGAEVPAAFVADWAALVDGRFVQLGGGPTRLLALAASLAAGLPVDLREHTPGLGSAHARRAVEAVLIATGMQPYLTIADTPAMDQLRAGPLADLLADDGPEQWDADVVGRCRWAIAHNDGHPNGAWSTGEQLAVALVLGDAEHLAAMQYTPQEAARRVLGGMVSPPADLAAWLGRIRSHVDESQAGDR